MIVAPLVGAWIEMPLIISLMNRGMSLLSWERGLKSQDREHHRPGKKVAPLVGAWIEILTVHHRISSGTVAPLVGAWIEILST